ncbi:portal protein [Pseudoxanthomonas sp. X-1]|uniref:portal protein n=1 Tax=Pseudoxanthomonas sp. X-1 TaxID=2571115 RepID=UPI00110BB1A6|nr:portal protein [Pseudoxanthomonas sp. X-1]TMN24507.1 phage tail protein [Pseudoxanthomonas sp. X-1]UAY75227.1 hypothetical protein LAJ50_02885 [Pseudoxanthomonas sp. X-1]
MAEKIAPGRSLAQQMLSRLGQLKSERASWDAHWRELDEYVQPRSSRFLFSDRNKGGKANQRILNNQATRSHTRLASGLKSGLTNPAQPWLKLGAADATLGDVYDVQVWLDETSGRVLSAFGRSNFYTQMDLVYESLGLYGIGALGIFEEDEDDIRCEFYPVGSYYVACSRSTRIDTFYREFQKKVVEMVSDYGLENCSAAVQSSYRNNSLDDLFTVIHVIEPNIGRNAESALSKDKRWRSYYFEPSEAAANKFLKQSGFDEFPIMAPRWRQVGNEAYGRSPAMDALGDIKELQYHERKKKQAIAKMVEPPMVAPTSLRNQAASTIPGEITYVDSTNAHDGFRPAYQVQFDVADTRGEINAIESRIQETFFEDVFRAITNVQRGNMREIEVQERVQERMMQMGPVLNRMNDELLDLAVDRVFAILARRGKLPPPPEDLEGADLKIEYVSILQQAQRQAGLQDLQQFIAFLGNIAGIYREDALDVTTPDRIMDSVAGKLGIDRKTLTSADERAAARQSRARAAQIQQMASLAQPAMQATQAAKNVAEMPINTGVAAALGVG